MKIGFPIWYGYGEKLTRMISEAASVGFNYIEISLDYPWPFRGRYALEGVIDEALDVGLSIAFHAPWRDIRLASPIEEVREASVKAFKRFLDEVSKYPCDYVVVHLSSDQAIDRIPEIRNEYVNSAVKSIKEIKSIGDLSGLRIVFENVREDVVTFKQIISKADSEVCLDVSHAICLAVRNSKRNRLDEEVKAWIGGLKDRIRVIHFSGLKFIGNWVKDHILVRKDDRYLKLVKSELENLRVENFLLEVFEDPDRGEVYPSQLREVVEFLKR